MKDKINNIWQKRDKDSYISTRFSLGLNLNLPIWAYTKGFLKTLRNSGLLISFTQITRRSPFFDGVWTAFFPTHGCPQRSCQPTSTPWSHMRLASELVRHCPGNRFGNHRRRGPRIIRGEVWSESRQYLGQNPDKSGSQSPYVRSRIPTKILPCDHVRCQARKAPAPLFFFEYSTPFWTRRFIGEN